MEKFMAIIDRFEGDKGVLRFNDGQQLVVNRSQLDNSAKEGDTIALNLQFDKQSTQDNIELAKQILQQILTNEPTTQETT